MRQARGRSTRRKFRTLPWRQWQSRNSLGRKYKADDISGGVGKNKIIRIVTSGKGHMPSFKRRLTAAQIAQIADYVKFSLSSGRPWAIGS